MHLSTIRSKTPGKGWFGFKNGPKLSLGWGMHGLDLRTLGRLWVCSFLHSLP